MLHWRLRVASGVFILLTVFKLLLPEQAGRVREELIQVIDLDLDLRAAAVEVGKHLTDEQVGQAVEAMLQLGGEREADTRETPPTQDKPAPDAELPDEQVLQAVAEFHLSQEAYAGYETPESVCYDCLTLPFSYVSPIAGEKSSGFGYRVHPIDGVVKFHYGTDYAAAEGTPIAAFTDGTVTMTGSEKGYGNYVQLTHSGGWQTFYAHCSEIQVTWGQQVKRGETIALSGNTGRTTGAHLHFELLHEGQYTNPEFFF